MDTITDVQKVHLITSNATHMVNTSIVILFIDLTEPSEVTDTICGTFFWTFSSVTPVPSVGHLNGNKKSSINVTLSRHTRGHIAREQHIRVNEMKQYNKPLAYNELAVELFSIPSAAVKNIVYCIQY